MNINGVSCTDCVRIRIAAFQAMECDSFYTDGNTDEDTQASTTHLLHLRSFEEIEKGYTF